MGLDVLAEHGGGEAHDALGQHLLRVPDLQLHRPADRLDHPLLEGGRPQLGVLRLDAVDQVHAEGEVTVSSRRMYWNCSPMPVIRFRRWRERDHGKP